MKKIFLGLLVIISLVACSLFFTYLNVPSVICENTEMGLCPMRLLVIHRNAIGEKEMAERIKCAAKKMNVACMEISLNSQGVIKKFFPSYTNFHIRKFKPTLILSLQGDEIDYKGAKQYVALTHGSDYYFSPRTALPIQDVMEFDGFLVGFPDQEKLSTYANFIQKPCRSMQWYSTCPESIFEPVKHFKLFYCGSNMANTPFGSKYKLLFSRLDRAGFLRVFGDKEEWRHTPQSYRGFIRSDGESLLKRMHEVGVTLVLHDPDHYLGGAPTARIFEAAAAGTVIISDNHPFVKKEFGDTVLYIDQNKEPEEIFHQIKSTMSWIRSHPEEANLLAKRSHAVFLEKFTLEQQLQRLFDLHQSLTIYE